MEMLVVSKTSGNSMDKNCPALGTFIKVTWLFKLV